MCNGTRLSASHWVRDGDVLRLGPTRVEVPQRADVLRLAVESPPTTTPRPPVVWFRPRSTSMRRGEGPGRRSGRSRTRLGAASPRATPAHSRA